jgi:hypothetical protein
VIAVFIVLMGVFPVLRYRNREKAAVKESTYYMYTEYQEIVNLFREIQGKKINEKATSD